MAAVPPAMQLTSRVVVRNHSIRLTPSALRMPLEFALEPSIKTEISKTLVSTAC